MKRVLLTLVVVAFALTASAAEFPVDKGSMLVGGSLYFMNQGGDLYKVGDEAQTTIGIMPEFGYFVAPSIMVGATIDWTNWSQGDFKESQMAFGPMVGYFFNMDPERTEIKGALYPYIKGFMMIGTYKYEDGTNPDEKANLMAFGGKGGINYMLTESVALDFGIMFSSDSYKMKEPVEADEATTGTTIQVGVGISAFVF